MVSLRGDSPHSGADVITVFTGPDGGFSFPESFADEVNAVTAATVGYSQQCRGLPGPGNRGRRHLPGARGTGATQRRRHAIRTDHDRGPQTRLVQPTRHRQVQHRDARIRGVSATADHPFGTASPDHQRRRAGEAGNWGVVPMVPSEHVSPEETRAIAAWVLDLGAP